MTRPLSPCQVCGAMIVQDGGDGFCSFCGKPLYPLLWRQITPSGWTLIVPCRLIHKGAARSTIAALRADGTEVVRSVKPESVIASSPGASGRPRPDYDPRIDYPERYTDGPI